MNSAPSQTRCARKLLQPAAVFTAVAGLWLSGCTYHGPLRSSHLTGQQTLPGKNETTVTLSNEMSGVNDIAYTVYLVTFVYYTKDAYLNAAKSTLESAYGHVDVGSEVSPTSKLLAVPYLKATTISTTNTSAELEVVSGIDIFRGPGGKPIRSYRSSQHVTWVEPGSAMALGFVTGLSLLILAPITLPIALQIEGNHGRDLIEHAVNDSLSTMGTQIAQDETRDQKRNEDIAKVEACFQSAAADPSLASISGLVALDDVRNQTFDMLASTKIPTEQERIAIKGWNELIAPCYAELEDFLDRWNIPAPMRALIGETKTASQNLRVLLYRGALSYGDYALKRQQLRDAFVTAEAKIETELAEQSAEAQARANTLAMQAQQTNLAAIQTQLIGLQTVNRATAVVQQQQQ